MKNKSSLTVLQLLFPVTCFAQVAMLEPIDSASVKSWSFASTGTECRELSDIGNAFVCLTQSQDDLSRLMARASYFVEGKPRGTVLSEDDNAFKASDQYAYVGHDIQRMDLIDFYAAMETACLSRPSMCANDLEQSLFDRVIAPASRRSNENFLVLAVEAKSATFRANISHEMLHAHFFLVPEYQAIVTEFWNNSVSATHRQLVEDFLGTTYNFEGAEGQVLLINEFQAYVLEHGSLSGELGSMAGRYGRNLQDSLGALLHVLPDDRLPERVD